MTPKALYALACLVAGVSGALAHRLGGLPHPAALALGVAAGAALGALIALVLATHEGGA